MTVWTGSLILAAIIFVIYVAICFNTDDQECSKATDTGVILNGTCFAMLSVLLVITVIPLFASLRSLSQGRMELTQGVKMLSAVFATFTFCYVTRTIFDFSVNPSTEFQSLYPGLILPVLWDFTPILLMFTYHFQNLMLINKTAE